MAFTKQTIRDIDLHGKTVLLRADYNVPLEAGKITDDYRIKQSLPTVEYLLEHAGKLIICAHLGRPTGPDDVSASLAPVAKRLAELSGHKVVFVNAATIEGIRQTVDGMGHGEIALLENLRYHKEEEANDPEFAKQLASLADVFVQDGFGVVHRAHASTEGVTHYLPSVAGFLLEREVDTITGVMEDPKRPLMAVVGGAKIADKIEILHRFIEIADVVAIGGAMANTFLKAEGHDIGASLADKDELPVARDILHKAHEESKKRRFSFYIPQDSVVANAISQTARTRIVDWSTHVVAEIENYPKRVPAKTAEVGKHEMILDIGPFSGAYIAGCMQLVETVIWNGTMGVTETAGLQGPIGPFAHGTDIVMEAMLGQMGSSGHKPFTVVGGGDTVGYVEQRGLVDAFSHVSTGGGASLELMAGRVLPGVAALMDKK